MSADIPSRIGRYVVDRRLGAGAMGFVYLGKDTELDRRIAIKTLRDLGMGAEALQTFMERFRNEARAAARLHHPSIVQVYDVGQDEQVGPYMVSEYVPGSTLKRVLQSRGPFSRVQVLRLAEQVGGAIDTAHAAGIIHRDVKPDNLLITDDGDAKLADFGVARVPDAALTREGQFLGTPCYAAPETLAGGKYSPQSDIFSFAAVLYEAISGTRAFPGSDAVAVAHKVIHDEPVALGHARSGLDVPPAVEAAVMGAMAKDPRARPRSAAELVDALRAAYGDRAPVPASAPAPGSPPSSSSSATLIAVALGLLAGGVALVLAFGGGTVTTTEDAGVDAAPAAPDAAGDSGADSSPGADASVGIPLFGSHEADSDTGPRDTGAAAPPLDPHQREEAAKDAIDEARRHVRAGAWSAARSALDRARRLDPGNGDIADIEQQLP